MKALNGISEILAMFYNQEDYYKKIQEKNSTKMIINQLIIISLFTFLYGVIMGSYHSFPQAIAGGVKLWLLFILTLIICFPSFYVIQLIIGSKIKLKDVLIIILLGFMLSTSVMMALSPIAIFFIITGNNYYFLHLLHIAIFIFSGFFGVRLVIESLKTCCENENIYPKIGITVFKIWAVIFVFVGIQLAWNLRPFMGDNGKPFALFRKYEGNFYTAIIYAVNHLNDNKSNTYQYRNNSIDSTADKRPVELLKKMDLENHLDSLKK